jgi:hypothetical protein
MGGDAEGRTNVNEQYDPVTDTWLSMTPMPTHRSALVAETVGGRIYAIGGGADEGDPDINEAYLPPAINQVFLPLVLKNFEIVPDTSLLLRMNEGTGASRFFDASGNGNDGSCSGDSCPTSGVVGMFGNALSFDGVNDYVQVNDSALPSGSAPRTMALWMKPESNARIPVFYGDPQPSDAYYVLVEGNNACIGQMGGGPLEVCGSTNITDGNWHFVALVYDGIDSVLLYLDNGILETSVTKTYNTTLTGELLVGRLTYEYYTGLIDELVIYDRALSEEEIKTLYTYGP